MSQFKPGQSGNISGRPAGSPNRRSQLAKLLDPYAEELVSILIGQARQGDPNAMRLCIERLIPKMKSEATRISLPAIDFTQTSALLTFRNALLQAISDQGGISMDSLKVVLELYNACKDVQHNGESDPEGIHEINELVKRYHKDLL